MPPHHCESVSGQAAMSHYVFLSVGLAEAHTTSGGVATPRSYATTQTTQGVVSLRVLCVCYACYLDTHVGSALLSAFPLFPPRHVANKIELKLVQ